MTNCPRCDKPPPTEYHHTLRVPSCPCGLHFHSEMTRSLEIGKYTVIFDTVNTTTKIWWADIVPIREPITLHSLKWDITIAYIEKLMVLK